MIVVYNFICCVIFNELIRFFRLVTALTISAFLTRPVVASNCSQLVELIWNVSLIYIHIHLMSLTQNIYVFVSNFLCFFFFFYVFAYIFLVFKHLFL